MVRVLSSMRRAAAAGFLLVSGVLAKSQGSISWQEAKDFFSGSQGFWMSNSDAERLATSQLPYLQQCEITKQYLNDLYRAMDSSLGMSRSDIEKQLLPIAYKKTKPEDLKSLMSVLRGSACGFVWKSDVHENVIAMAKNGAMADDLKSMCLKLQSPGYRGWFESTKERVKWAQYLVVAGADASKLSGVSANWDSDVKIAVRENLGGFVRRYAKDCKLYTAKDFQRYYPHTWEEEWVNAIEEKRFAPDQKDYFARDFKAWFKGNWGSYWKNGARATQRRISTADKKAYDLKEYCSFYKDKWQTEFESGAVLPSRGQSTMHV